MTEKQPLFQGGEPSAPPPAYQQRKLVDCNGDKGMCNYFGAKIVWVGSYQESLIFRPSIMFNLIPQLFISAMDQLTDIN